MIFARHADNQSRRSSWPTWSVAFLGLMHVVGLLGFTFGVADFERLVPMHLLLTFAVWLANQFPWPSQFRTAVVINAAFGFIVEVIGVRTGLLFGDYQYGRTLGPQVLDVPVIMALNWALLLAVTGEISFKFVKPSNLTRTFLAAGFGASLMTLLDVVIEPFAIRYGLWQWDDESVPLFNYASWWLLSFAALVVNPPNVNQDAHSATGTRGQSQASYWVYAFQFAFFTLMLTLNARYT